jgi:hypothetical protein
MKLPDEQAIRRALAWITDPTPEAFRRDQLAMPAQEQAERPRPAMTYFAISLIVIWLCVLFFLVGRTLNLMRLVYNNIAPGRSPLTPATYFRFYIWNYRRRFLADASGIDPADLTETGRHHQNDAIRNDRITLAWVVGGFVLLVAYSFSKT